MHTEILDLLPPDASAPECKRVLSFYPFLNYIKQISRDTKSNKRFFFSYVIEQLEKNPGFLQPSSPEVLKDYEGLMELVFSSLTSMIDDENNNLWALSLPMKPTIFYSTNAFFNLVTCIAAEGVCTSVTIKGPSSMEGHPVEFVYSLILEKFYDMPAYFSREIVHSLEDRDSGLTRYYKAEIDTRFIEITALKDLPVITFDYIKSGNYNKEEKLQWLHKVLPLNIFQFEGFGITTITEVSVKYAVENIKNFILTHSFHDDKNYFSNVTSWLKTIVNSNDIEFGLLPALYVNRKLKFNDGLYINSILVQAAQKKGLNNSEYMPLVEKYFSSPKLISFSGITKEEEERHDYLKFLTADGIVSYALVPIYFGSSLVGVLEIYSRKKIQLNEVLLSKLDPVIPLLSQLLKNSIHEFHDSIDKVIKDKFTSIQPSVQWKFNEAAWHYLRDKQGLHKAAELEDILFENVYPLYGAVDIRNSTVERNLALNNDLKVQFRILLETLEKLKENSGFSLVDEKIFLANKWLEDMLENSVNGEHFSVNDFLENNIAPFLHDFAKGNTWAQEIVDEYFNAINEHDGVAFEARRRLEISMRQLISSVNNYFDRMQEDIQHAYPCYFEKFRTDGVEYDIYIGQTIAPEKPFSEIYLKNLRLMQLNSMAEVTKLTEAVAQHLPVPIQTTQLIFIHSFPILIKFRKDEKRFDVEGAYNIRYQVVKKRIDKVLVKGTQERLTQPGKIAMVYFNQQDANEYIGYIEYLQQQKILLNDLEKLELEELQGVSGLKALRVSVATEAPVSEKVSAIVFKQQKMAAK